MCAHQKPFVFGLMPFFRQFVRSKTNFVFLAMFICQTDVYFPNHVVLSYFRLITNRSKLFCGVTLLGREKNFLLLVLVTCLSLLLGMGVVVFLAAWCVRTRMRLGWQMIPGGKCL
jgi:hypothetical protein